MGTMRDEPEDRRSKAAGRPAKGLAKDKLVARRRMRMDTVLGVVFCVVGGVISLLSAILAWVVPSAGSSGADIYLSGLLQQGGSYLFALLVPFAAILVAFMAALEPIQYSRGRRAGAVAPLGAMLFALLGVVALLVVVLRIDADYLSGSSYMFGPAVFLAVFGDVIATAGAMVLTVEHLERGRRAGRPIMSKGSRDLAEVLRPKKRPGMSEDDATERGQRDEVMAADEARRAKEACEDEGGCCPSCHSPVRPDWRVCPICGEELA